MNKNLTIKEVIETYVEFYNPENLLTLVVKSKFDNNANEIKNKLLLFKECVNTIEIELKGENDEENVEFLEGMLSHFLRLSFAISE
jgi:hypothetical protein